jgi:hypothetical protein
VDKNKLDGVLMPTAEMQLGETDVKQLVKDADFGGRSTEACSRHLDAQFGVGDQMRGR